MCWSATADLVAGTAIGAAGAVCVVRVLRGDPARRTRDLPLAALPLLLGAHQIVEARLWHDGGGTGTPVLVWAVIALPLLPLWLPLAVAAATLPGRTPTGRLPAVPLRIAVPLAVGAVTSAVLAHRLATTTVTAEIHGRTVGYAVGLPAPAAVITGYLLATVGALLLARDPVLRLLGAVTGAGAVACALLWRNAFVSTWCALAAVASVLILVWTGRDPGTRPGTGTRFASRPGAREAGDDTPSRAARRPAPEEEGPP
ncbi:DUF6629 family protein [Streptomyces sp. NPDC006798]|uniref:DUF6629 family protein n=1 Tax=Streptomyces sp. NPDC006798 TaxID=3155462 RepID=UPI0033DEE135